MTCDVKQDCLKCLLCGKAGKDHTYAEWIQHHQIHGDDPCPSCAALRARLSLAEAVIKAVRKTNEDVRPYRCRHCPGWHVGHEPGKQRTRRQNGHG